MCIQTILSAYHLHFWFNFNFSLLFAESKPLFTNSLSASLVSARQDKVSFQADIKIHIKTLFYLAVLVLCPYFPLVRITSTPKSPIQKGQGFAVFSFFWHTGWDFLHPFSMDEEFLITLLGCYLSDDQFTLLVSAYYV